MLGLNPPPSSPPTSDVIRGWNVKDVSSWLCEKSLDEFAPLFSSNDIDGDLLLELTADDLKDLNVTSLGKRMRIIREIDTLRNKIVVPKENYVDAVGISGVEDVSSVVSVPDVTSSAVAPVVLKPALKAKPPVPVKPLSVKKAGVNSKVNQISEPGLISPRKFSGVLDVTSTTNADITADLTPAVDNDESSVVTEAMSPEETLLEHHVEVQPITSSAVEDLQPNAVPLPTETQVEETQRSQDFENLLKELDNVDSLMKDVTNFRLDDSEEKSSTLGESKVSTVDPATEPVVNATDDASLGIPDAVSCGSLMKVPSKMFPGYMQLELIPSEDTTTPEESSMCNANEVMTNGFDHFDQSSKKFPGYMQLELGTKSVEASSQMDASSNTTDSFVLETVNNFDNSGLNGCSPIEEKMPHTSLNPPPLPERDDLTSSMPSSIPPPLPERDHPTSSMPSSNPPPLPIRDDLVGNVPSFDPPPLPGRNEHTGNIPPSNPPPLPGRDERAGSMPSSNAAPSLPERDEIPNSVIGTNPPELPIYSDISSVSLPKDVLTKSDSTGEVITSNAPSVCPDIVAAEEICDTPIQSTNGDGMSESIGCSSPVMVTVVLEHVAKTSSQLTARPGDFLFVLPSNNDITETEWCLAKPLNCMGTKDDRMGLILRSCVEKTPEALNQLSAYLHSGFSKHDKGSKPIVPIAAVELRDPTWCGWLSKIGGTGLRRNWRRRYFVLKDFCLFYYKTPDDEFALGKIPLIGYAIKPAQGGKRFHFKAVHPANSRIYEFIADSQDEFKLAMDVMSRAAILEFSDSDVLSATTFMQSLAEKNVLVKEESNGHRVASSSFRRKSSLSKCVVVQPVEHATPINPPIVTNMSSTSLNNDVLSAETPCEEFAIALYDNSADDIDELEFSEGDRLKVIDRAHADWWMCETASGKYGLVAACYVQLE